MNKNCYKSTVGCSPITPFKQEDLKHLLSSQIGKMYGVWKKYKDAKWFTEDEVFLIDCTAGDMNKEKETSPKIFLESILKYPELPSKLYLIEENPNTYSDLWTEYQMRYKPSIMQSENSRVFLRNKNMQEVLGNFSASKFRYGLIYFDPNGFVKEDYEALFLYLEKNQKMDVVLNINIGMLNRLRPISKAEGFQKYHNLYLTTILRRLSKKYIWIRDNSQLQVCSKYTFVMVFGTNMPNYDIGKQNRNFYPIDSIKGQEIIQKHNFTRKEREDENNKI